mmetsp:Transcript_6715/g.20158  ORF Transcript_6715/g.20158 Transcript_6715/m.20158 type:complete len:197 (-) Transcript_6715:1965-2555(-)
MPTLSQLVSSRFRAPLFAFECRNSALQFAPTVSIATQLILPCCKRQRFHGLQVVIAKHLVDGVNSSNALHLTCAPQPTDPQDSHLRVTCTCCTCRCTYSIRTCACSIRAFNAQPPLTAFNPSYPWPHPAIASPSHSRRNARKAHSPSSSTWQIEHHNRQLDCTPAEKGCDSNRGCSTSHPVHVISNNSLRSSSERP